MWAHSASPLQPFRQERPVFSRQVRNVLVVASHEHREGRVTEHLGDPAGIFSRGQGIPREGVSGVIEIGEAEARPSGKGRVPNATSQVGDVVSAGSALVFPNSAGGTSSGSESRRRAGGETIRVEVLATTTGYAPPPRETQDPTYEPPRRSHSVARRRSCSAMAALTSGVMGAQPARTMVRINTALTRAMAFMRYIPRPPRVARRSLRPLCSRSQASILVDDAGEGLAESVNAAGRHPHRWPVTQAMRSKLPS